MRSPVREKPVDNQSSNGEDEDTNAPKQLVQRRAVGFENLNYRKQTLVSIAPDNLDKAIRTPDHDIKNQHNESKHTTTGTKLPRIAVGGRSECLLGCDEGDEGEV
jgi:hypothetical protein